MNFQKHITDLRNDKNKIYVDPSITSNFIAKTFGWMFIGLFSTFLTIVIFSRSYTLMSFIFGQGAIPFFVLLVAELFISTYLSSININRISLNKSKTLFIIYSIMNGMTLSILAFNGLEVITSAALITSVSFGSMALYGYLTKADLSKFTSIINVSLITLVGSSLMNIFFKIAIFRLISSYLGALTFIFLIAYDTNRLKKISAELAHYETAENISKYSIRGAITLYIKVINIFLYVLRIISSKSKKN